MNQKPNHLPTESPPPPIKVKRVINRRRLIASGLMVALVTFFAASALLLLFAFMFAPQLSNVLWNTDATQNSLYGTSAAVHNAQIIVNMTSTQLENQSQSQQDLILTINSDKVRLDAREADLMATDEAMLASIHATATAELIANEQQRTQAAINYSETQLAINQQSTRIASEATLTQVSLQSQPQPTITPENRPFSVRDEVTYMSHPDGQCDWQGIAGSVLNLENNLTGDSILKIRLLTTDDEVVITVGDNLDLDPIYNWAIKIGDVVRSDVYFLRLESLTGEPLSPMIRVIFDGTCESNLAVVNLSQAPTVAD